MKKNLKIFLYFLYLSFFTMILSGIISCTSTKNIPTITQNNVSKVEEKIVIRDSLIYIPLERIVEVVPSIDTLKMEITNAMATAYLDSASMSLKGELKSKEGTKKQVIEKIVYVLKTDTVYIDKPYPIEVEAPIPKIYKYSLIFSILIIVIGVLKLKGIFF